MKDKLKNIKHTLLIAAEEQMAHLECVDTKELGEVIDMIKDLEEAMYYCTVTDAMHQKGYATNYYSEPMDENRMYYDGGYTYARDNSGGVSRHVPADGGYHMRSLGDPREGTSHAQRRMYMESKEMHHGKAKQLQELEKYMKELSNDLVEMIEDASPEEKQYLGNKLATLATKISKLEA